MEIEDEDETGSLKDNDFVSFVLQGDVCLWGVKPTVLRFALVHHGIKVVQELVAEKRVLGEIELAAGIPEGVLVTLTRKIEPLGMTELIALEIEVAFTTQAVGEQANQFMQSNTAVNNGRQRRQYRHIGVHFRVAEMHHQGLIANKAGLLSVVSFQWKVPYSRLIVTLTVRDCLFTVSAVRQCKADVADIPLLVLELFQDLDPHIWNCHSQTVIEANSTKLRRDTQGRHSGHIFGDGYALRVQGMKHLVGKHHVYNGFFINIPTEILVVPARKATEMC